MTATHVKIPTTTFLVACLPLLACGTVVGDPFRFFDTHAHQMPASFPANWLDSLVADHDPHGIVLMGIGDVLSPQADDPNRVVAFSNFHGIDDVNLTRVQSQLDNGMRGIGEISIRHFASGPSPAEPVESDFDDPKFLQVYDLAREHDVPVNFHFDYHPDHIGEIVRTLPDYPDVTFIWAHAGDTQPGVLGPLMTQLDNLYIDISSRNPLSSFEGRLVSKALQRLDDADGTIKATWKTLFETFPDRVLYGSDIGPPGRLEQYGQIQAYYRGILDQLDPQVAERITYRNARMLFPATVPEPTSLTLVLLTLIAASWSFRGRGISIHSSSAGSAAHSSSSSGTTSPDTRGNPALLV